MTKPDEKARDADDQATGIPNRKGPGTDPEPAPPRGEPKEKPGPHAERPNGDHAP